MVLSYCADESQWRPIELRSSEDVEQLNALLASGWRIEPLEIDGLPFLAFCGRKGTSLLAGPDAPARLLLILQRAVPTSRTQRAIFVARTASGYIELPTRGRSSTRVERSRPGFVAVFPIGRDGVVSIQEVE